MIEPNNLSPFRHFCMTIGAIPSSYKESLTYYEMLEWLCKYLEETVIPAVNNNAEALEELQTAFVTLKDYVDHYFDDLDIQAEINAKLDEMAESGELADIIAQYLQLSGVLAYDSVADLKTATNLVNGSFAETYGYYNYKDGGGALYKIRNVINTDEPDDVTIIALADENLVAELLINELNVKQFGAKGDGETDDTVAIQKAFDYLRTWPRADKDYSNLYFPEGEYIITNTITINSGRWCKVHGRATIKANMNKPMLKLNSTMWYVFSDLIFRNSNTGTSSCSIEIENSYTNKFQNIYIEGGYKGVNIIYGNQLMFDNVSIQQCSYGVYTTSHGDNTENIFNNCTMEACTVYNIYLGYVDQPYYGKFIFNNCYIEGSPSNALIYIENGMQGEFNNCYINATGQNGTIIHQTGTIPYMKATFNNSYFTGNTNVYLIKQLADTGIVKGVKFDNKCIFTGEVKLYNTGDAVKPKIGKLTRDKINAYNLTHFQTDTNNKLIGWNNANATYTISETIDPESLCSVDVSSGYAVKEIYLKAGVTYDFEVMTKTNGYEYSSLELFNKALNVVYFTANSYASSWTRLIKTYTPNTSQVYTILIRAHAGNVSSFCGLRVYSNELDLTQNRAY